jgi:cytochrome c-type biogenesis protein CcmH/NrfG
MSTEHGHLTEAIQIYIKLLENNPEDVETLNVLGNICLSMENYDDADVFFNKAIGIEPWNSEITASGKK